MASSDHPLDDRRPKPHRKYHYREAFVRSPNLGLNPIKVERISDGIAILKAVGEGKLCVCTRTRPKNGGWYTMAECDLRELSGKTEAAIYALLDKKTDDLSKSFHGKYVLEDRIIK